MEITATSILTLIAIISAITTLVSTIVNIKKSKIEKQDIEAKITETLEKVYGKIITTLQKQVKDLETEITVLKTNENKWYKKYYRLLVLIQKEMCESCKNILNKHLSEEGET